MWGDSSSPAAHVNYGRLGGITFESMKDYAWILQRKRLACERSEQGTECNSRFGSRPIEEVIGLSHRARILGIPEVTLRNSFRFWIIS